MTGREHRQDDRRDTGYCPHCANPLSGVTRAALGYCEQHGWVWAEWNVPNKPQGEHIMRTCILTPENIHTEDDCTMHDHEEDDNESEGPASDPRPDPRTHPEYWTE